MTCLYPKEEQEKDTCPLTTTLVDYNDCSTDETNDVYITLAEMMHGYTYIRLFGCHETPSPKYSVQSDSNFFKYRHRLFLRNERTLLTNIMLRNGVCLYLKVL